MGTQAGTQAGTEVGDTGGGTGGDRSGDTGRAQAGTQVGGTGPVGLTPAPASLCIVGCVRGHRPPFHTTLSPLENESDTPSRGDVLWLALCSRVGLTKAPVTNTATGQ